MNATRVFKSLNFSSKPHFVTCSLLYKRRN